MHVVGLSTPVGSPVPPQAAPARVLETRKTVPGLRLLDKWAVIIGKGENHRMGLFDMVMIKVRCQMAVGKARSSHWLSCRGSIEPLLRRGRRTTTWLRRGASRRHWNAWMRTWHARGCPWRAR